MSRKLKTASIDQDCPPKRKRQSSESSEDDDDFVSMEMFQEAIFEDNFLYLEDNLDRYIQQQGQRIGESKIEEQLLEEALKGGAQDCLGMLQNSPYNKKHRCIRDLFQACEEEDMRKVEAILPKMPKRFLNLRYDEDNCSVASMLLRPLDVVLGMEHARIINELSRRKRRSSRSTPMAELSNLFFEVILSTPALWEQLDSLEGLDSQHWCLLAPSKDKWRAHLRGCIGFPQCLFQYKTSTTSPAWGHASTSLSSIFKLWMAHRFQSRTDRASMDPPSLLVCCRIRMRTWLISLQKRQPECPNYLTLVNRFPLSQKLRNFLLFKELWPSGPARYYSSDEDSPLNDQVTESMEDTSDSDDYC